MGIKHGPVTVGTTAVSLTAAFPDTAGKYAEATNAETPSRSILLSEASATLYIGGPGVTTTTYGYKLAVGGELTIDLYPGDEPFAVAAGGGTTVQTLHTGV